MSSAESLKPEKLKAYREARRMGTEWLLGHMNADGSIGDPDERFFFYRAPWTFVVAGEVEAAHAVCGWIRRNMWTDDGRVDGGYRKSGMGYGYKNSTLIIGAHLALQYDLSHGLMPELLSWQDPQSGAFADHRLEDGSKSDDMDIPFTCGPGLACLITGHIDPARRVYEHLKRIYEAQEDLPDCFYYTWSRESQAPITDYPEEQQRLYVVENRADRRQRWTIGGISAGFLCRLYLVDPRPEYLELARKYQQFSMEATPHQFRHYSMLQEQLGSSLLYQITGEDAYLEWTYKMGDWYIETQNEQGYWDWDYYTTLGDYVEVALEFVMYINTLIGGLASRP